MDQNFEKLWSFKIYWGEVKQKHGGSVMRDRI